jgi:hypothetical protein
MAGVCFGCTAGDAATTGTEGGAITVGTSEQVDPEQAVIVHLTLSGDGFGSESDRDGVFELEDALIAAVENARVGEYDGNEFGAGEAVLYAYGPDADSLFEVMEPVIAEFGPGTGSYAIKRYGGADDASAQEYRVSLE